MKLRYYQEQLKADIMQALQTYGNVLAVAPCRSGKTVTFSSILLDSMQQSVVMAHREEINYQISMTLARNGVHHNIIGARSLKDRVARDHVRLFKKTFYDPRSPIHVASVGSLVNQPEGFLNKIKLWINDECFVAGTLVDGIPIEQLRVGDFVTAFDETTGNFEKKKVVHVFKNKIHDTMMRLKFAEHHIDCTLNHPIYTKRGFIPACNLTTDDEVLFNGLQDLRERNNRQKKNMFDRMSKQGVIYNCIKNKYGVRFRPYEIEKSNALRRQPKKSIGNFEKNEAQAKSARWKWETPLRSRNIIVKTVGMDTSIYPKNRFVSGKISATPPCKNRLSKPYLHDSHRNRWFFTLQFRKERPRLKENNVFNWVRLESIEIYEPSSAGRNGDGFVYNLEVDDFSTYTANGVVVHNCHHLVKGSTWDKCIQAMPNAKGIGFTATPIRLDGKGLGLHDAGLFQTMVIAPGARELIEQGYIADYKIVCPSSVKGIELARISSNGDYRKEDIQEIIGRSSIVGDMYAAYNKYLQGLKGLVFTDSVESAERMSKEFNELGIPSAAISGKTAPETRAKALEKLQQGVLKIVFNCELFGEGTDLPAINFVIMARPTKSFGLYYQQFFRPLTKDGDKKGIIVDMVGNVLRHGLPDADIKWTLDGVKKGSKPRSSESIRVCPECMGAYSIVKYGRVCPYCEHALPVQPRSTIQQVDGDLRLLSPEELAIMRQRIEDNNTMPVAPYNASKVVVNSIAKHHREKLAALDALKEAIAVWATGKTDIPQAQREFWTEFNIDVMSAQTLNKSEAIELMNRIKK